MHFTRVFITEQGRCFAKTNWQITVGMLCCLVYIILEWAGHWTKCKYFFIFFFITQNKHTVLVMIPVSGDLVQIALGHQWCLGSYIAPFVILQIFNPSLKFFYHDHTLWHQQRQPLSNDIHGCEQFHFTAQFVVVTLQCFFSLFQIFF